MEEPKIGKQPAVLGALMTLAMSAASLALALFAVAGGAWLPGFIQDNRLAPPLRRYLIFAIGAAAIAAVVAATVSLLRRGSAMVPLLIRLARLCAVVPLVGLLPPLMNPRAWPDPLVGSLAVSAFVIALVALLSISLGEMSTLPLPAVSLRLPRRTGLIVVAVLAVLYAAYMSYFTILNHRHFNTFSYDLGIYDNQFWQALHGHPFRSTPSIHEGKNWSILKIHAEFSMYAFIPFYALAPRAETLLIIQSVTIAAGAIPVYRITARRLSPSVALLLALTYFLYPALHGANFYDFHFQPLGATFVLFTIDFLDERRLALTAIFYVLAVGCREDISFGLICFGLYLALEGSRFRTGVILAAVSAAWFVAVKFIIMPQFGQYWFSDMYKQLYTQDDRNYGGIVKTMLTNPWFVFKTLMTQAKLRYALQILAPLAFLPLRKPLLWIILIPGFFFTLLTTEYSATTEISFQYSCHFIPYLFFAAAVILAEHKADVANVPRYRASVVGLAVASLLCTIQWGAIPPRIGFHSGFSTVNSTPLTDADRRFAKDLSELAAMVPFTAKLAVSEAELPHVAERPECYTLRYGHQGADYILYSRGSGNNGSTQAEEALRRGEFVEMAFRPRLSLLKRVK